MVVRFPVPASYGLRNTKNGLALLAVQREDVAAAKQMYEGSERGDIADSYTPQGVRTRIGRWFGAGVEIAAPAL